MRKKYDREEMFEKVSESYELGLGPVAYCERINFPIKVFYRYRQQYIKIYGEAPIYCNFYDLIWKDRIWIRLHTFWIFDPSFSRKSRGSGYIRKHGVSMMDTLE